MTDAERLTALKNLPEADVSIVQAMDVDLNLFKAWPRFSMLWYSLVSSADGISTLAVVGSTLAVGLVIGLEAGKAHAEAQKLEELVGE